jgi:serine/threonine protein kinase
MNGTSHRLMGRRFELVRRLGSGGMAVVYDAIDQVTNARVALKVLSAIDNPSRARFKREFRTMQDIQHPNLVRLHELFEDDDLLFFTMDLVEGVDFLQFVRRHALEAVTEDTWTSYSVGHPSQVIRDQASATLKPAFDEVRLRSVLAQLVHAVSTLHENGLVHRDIKPSNILITQSGQLRLLDFGLISDPSTHLSTAQQIVGTAGYMAPEQAGDSIVSPPADWYSVGVLLFESLTGRLPFVGAALDVLAHKRLYSAPLPSALVFHLPPDLDRLCGRLLSRDPRERPSGNEIAIALSLDLRIPALTAGWARGPRRTNDEFVGRLDERRWLHSQFERVRSEGTVAVAIEGESGIGKSALVRQFLEELSEAEPSLVVLRGRCYEREAVAYKGIDGIVDSLLAFLRRLPGETAAALAPRHSAALTLQFPALAAIPTLIAGVSAARQQDPQTARTHAMQALRELLLRLADRYPLVIWLDDLQWIDPDGKLVLDEVLHAPDAPSALVLITRATTASDRVSDVLPCAYERLALGPLALNEARALLISSAQRAGIDLDAELSYSLAEEALGHPIFLRELVLYSARKRNPGRLGSVLLDDMLWERIEGLAPELRTVLELVTVSGSPIPLGVAAAATGLEIRSAMSSITDLRTARLLATTPATAEIMLQPAHDRVRKTVLRHLDPTSIINYHRSIAKALEGSEAPDAELLANHWAQAGELDRAARHATRAAFTAARSFAFGRAISLFQLALSGTSDADTRHALLVAQGEALANAGRGPEAARIFLECAASTMSPDTALELRRRAAEQFLRSGHIDEGLDVLPDVLAAVRIRFPRTPRAALASLLYHRAWLALRGLNYVERAEADVPPAALRRLDVCWSVASGLSLVDTVRGSDFQTRTLLLALGAGEPHRLARALAVEASFAAAESGRNRRRVEPLLELTRAQAKKSGHPNAAGWLALSQGIVSMMYGRFEDSERFTSEAETIFRDQCHGTAWELTNARAFRIWSLVMLGRLRELADKVPDLVRDSHERGDRLGLMTLISGPMYMLRLAQDEPRTMRDECKNGLSRWAQGGFHFQHLCGLFTLAAADLYEGLVNDAVEYVEMKWKEVERSLLPRVQYFRLDLWALRGRVALAAAERGSESRHIRRVRSAIAHIEREGTTWASGYALALHAGIAGLSGDRRLAVSFLERAEDSFASSAMIVHAAVCTVQRGLVGGTSGVEELSRGCSLLTKHGVRHPLRFAAMLVPMPVQ